MQFGMCGPVEQAGIYKAAGADFVEESVQTLLQGMVEDSQWQGLARAKASALPIPSANVLMPGDLKLTGPVVDFEKVRHYMTHVMRRARSVGIQILVFGSAGARNPPDGYSRDKARDQILQFLQMSAGLAGTHGVTLVVEPLNRKESNIINTVGEAMTYVKDIGHPNLQCLVDSYHFWLDDNNLDDLESAMSWIRHVHVADKDGRVPPGESGKSDYRPFFRVIKQAGYNGRISVETPGYEGYKEAAPRFMAFLRQQWQDA